MCHGPPPGGGASRRRAMASSLFVYVFCVGRLNPYHGEEDLPSRFKALRGELGVSGLQGARV